MKLKACGITDLAQLLQLQALGVDYAGLIFYEKSKRYAHEKLEPVVSEIKKLPIKKVGVFVNADMETIWNRTTEYGLSAVQLHGDETPEFCGLTSDGLNTMETGAEVIKAIRIKPNTEVTNDLTGLYQSACDYFLFDTDTEGFGGSGKRFDWTVLQRSIINKPFFLSGGIGPDDLDGLQDFSHPFFYGADINSRFETSPGIKDMSLLKSFVNTLKQHSYG